MDIVTLSRGEGQLQTVPLNIIRSTFRSCLYFLLLILVTAVAAVKAETSSCGLHLCQFDSLLL